MENRYLSQEVRVVTSSDGKKQLSGYAAVFNSTSQNLGGFKEIVAPGAFTRTLRDNPDVKAISEHDARRGILGRTKSNTLRLSEDERGLKFDIDLPNTSLASDLVESIGRGDLDGMSFAFTKQKDDWHKVDGETIRTLLDVDLHEITVTANPAYLGTSVSLRSLFPDGAPVVPEFRDAEDATPEVAPSCECECPECQAGDCEDCSMMPCMDPNCTCNEGRSNKLLASVIERRLRSV